MKNESLNNGVEQVLNCYFLSHKETAETYLHEFKSRFPLCINCKWPQFHWGGGICFKRKYRLLQNKSKPKSVFFPDKKHNSGNGLNKRFIHKCKYYEPIIDYNI